MWISINEETPEQTDNVEEYVHDWLEINATEEDLSNDMGTEIDVFGYKFIDIDIIRNMDEIMYNEIYWDWVYSVLQCIMDELKDCNRTNYSNICDVEIWTDERYQEECQDD